MKPPAVRLEEAVKAIIAAGAATEALAALRTVHMRATHKRARGGGASSKAKGRSFMVRVAELLTERLGLSPGDVFVKATSQIGCDLHLSPAAEKVFPFSVEGKNVETLNIWAALQQAESNASEGRPAVVFFTRAHHGTYVAMRAEVFLAELRGQAGSTGEVPR